MAGYDPGIVLKQVRHRDLIFAASTDIALGPTVLVQKTIQAGSHLRRRGSHGWVWYLVTAGRGRFSGAHGVRAITAGCVVVHCPVWPFAYVVEESLEVLGASFSGTEVATQFPALVGGASDCWPVAQFTRCCTLWDQCWTAATAPDGPVVARHLSMAMLASSRAQRDAKPNSGSDLVERARAEFERGACRGVSVAGVAARLGVSYEHLSRRFRQHLGCSPQTYCQRLRRQHAEHLLETGDLSLEEVAAEVGYADYPAFSRAFRNWTGLTPSAVRDAGA